MLKISGLYIYPIKSLPGIAVSEARITDRGFEYDRRWMLVDENNLFISQREAPQMTQLVVSIEINSLLVKHRTLKNSIVIPFATRRQSARLEVTVWDDTCAAEYVSEDADKWFSKMLGIKCRLVYMPDDSRRLVDQRYTPANSITSFSDGYPFLVIGQASLDDLNRRLAEPLPMNRFRPNLVFTGGAPFEEDMMAHFIVAGIDFYGVKLCARCPIPTIDQENGSRGKEPLKTLAAYRRKDNKVLFGQNLVHGGQGVINIGDKMEVLAYNTKERFIIDSRPEKDFIN